jgi:hypothetical protein
MMPSSAEMRIALDNDLRRMRERYEQPVCMVSHPETIKRVFETEYRAAKWCDARQLVLMVTKALPEGGCYFGNQQILLGGDDAIRAMLEDAARA